MLMGGIRGVIVFTIRLYVSWEERLFLVHCHLTIPFSFSPSIFVHLLVLSCVYVTVFPALRTVPEPRNWHSQVFIEFVDTFIDSLFYLSNTM